MSKERNWKDELLKSGLPLEYQVATELEKRGWTTESDRQYLRIAEDGTVKAFSYDIHATLVHLEDNAFTELLIECKYRHESVNWIFTPKSWNRVDEIGVTDLVNGIDQLTGRFQPYLRMTNPVGGLAPLLGKGVELLPKDVNHSAIRRGTSQISWAFCELQLRSLETQLDPEQRHLNRTLFALLPVIATTANLFRLREKTDIDAINHADELTDIADGIRMGVLHSPPSVELVKQNHARLSSFVAKNRGAIDFRNLMDDEQMSIWLKTLSQRPQLFLVCNINDPQVFDTITTFARDTMAFPETDQLLHAWFLNE